MPLAEVKSQWNEGQWYGIAAGKGTMLLAALRTHLGAAKFDKALDDFGLANAGKPVTTAAFREHMDQAAGHSLAPLFDPWLTGNATSDSTTENFWAIDSFEPEPEHALIVYGTQQDRAAEREAADLLQRKIAHRGSNYTVPIKADSDVSDDDLKNHHLLLIGRPATNAVTAKLADGLTIRFGDCSFTVRGETYAHADSTVIAAGRNRLNDRYSIVVYAGLGARATRACIENIPNRAGEPAEILLIPHGQPVKSLRTSAPPLATAKP